MNGSSDVLTTVREVKLALGGNTAVAILTGSKPSAAGNWGGPKCPQFPSKTFVVMNEALAAIGKSAPASLWGMKIPEDAA